ncbi:hypothetical protein [Pseudonocardia alni]|uniref:hypothetical protein n=1 Tax=Pseudonocardia alni TaxID=33907 RepID=UPI00333233DA
MPTTGPAHSGHGPAGHGPACGGTSRAARRVVLVLPAVLLVGVLGAGCAGSSPLAPTRGAETAAGPSASAVASPSDSTSDSTSTGAGPPVPIVLGSPDRPQARGLGTPRPSLVDLGGASSTGIVEDLTWQSWGGPTATGTGTAAYAAPGQPLAAATRERATVIAADPGTCAGRPAYRTLTWYFPQHGEVPGAHPRCPSAATDRHTVARPNGRIPLHRVT